MNPYVEKGRPFRKTEFYLNLLRLMAILFDLDLARKEEGELRLLLSQVSRRFGKHTLTKVEVKLSNGDICAFSMDSPDIGFSSLATEILRILLGRSWNAGLCDCWCVLTIEDLEGKEIEFQGHLDENHIPHCVNFLRT